MKLLALLACITLYVGISNAHNYDPCPTYWLKNGKSCYRYFGQLSNWITAENICRMFSGCSGGIGHLVSINDAAENDFVFNLVKGITGGNVPPPTWLGGRRYAATQLWQWSDGTTVSPYNAWAQGQAPQQQGRNCMVFSETALPTWRDINCRNEMFPYICEMQANVPVDPNTCATGGTGTGTNPSAQPVPFRYTKSGNVEQRRVSEP
ncbi:echinoidin-like [Asterias rubens]|uniref:echinoidin-like n=1 Tax=Asterias rubens TaxID=7604 RepID=UPI00145536B1|nr:echinoidin-like [Asterias rubens]